MRINGGQALPGGGGLPAGSYAFVLDQPSLVESVVVQRNEYVVQALVADYTTEQDANALKELTARIVSSQYERLG